MVEVFMPKSGMDMQEGTLVRWLKEVGDIVEIDEPIMEIETDKITMEAESPAAGFLIAKTVEAGATVPVLAVMGYIGQKGEKVPENIKNVSREANLEAIEKQNEAKITVKQFSNGSHIAATPYAKKVAGELGIDLFQVVPGGKHGEILAKDVISTQQAKKGAHDLDVVFSGASGCEDACRVKGADEHKDWATQRGKTSAKPISTMRKVISQRMTKSHQEIPTVTQHVKVDVTQLLEMKARINENIESNISLNDLILKVVAQAVKEHECVRTTIEGGEYIVKSDVNIGFAVGLEDGLLVPVIKNADAMSLSDISAQAKKLAKSAREGSIKPQNLSGGTFTVSNLGMFDVYAFTPIINQPEAGILGVCSVEDELALVAGEVVVKKKMMISLTYDHRIMDGVGAAKFQLRIKQLLENPVHMLV